MQNLGAQRWQPNVQVSWDFLNSSVCNLRLKVKNFSADRVLISSEFQTAGAVAENAREEKTMLTCGRCRSGAEAERDILLLNDTPQLHRKDMTIV